MVVQTPTKSEQDNLRGCLKNNPRSIWGQSFASLALNDSVLESHDKEVEVLKVKVKNMLLKSANELTDNIEFINLLCRLGLSYHFEDEIDEQLNRIFTMLPKLLEDNDYGLCTLANLFRILRQYGYKMTCDVFEKFKEGDGEFKEDIANDVKGILSLYEACFLATFGEDILDETLVFTRKQLAKLAKNSSPHLQKHIRNSLMYPSHHTIERLDTLRYISFYEEDESADKTLLKFAKLDYNGLQLFYRKELALLSRWWEDLNVSQNIPYARDRLVESYVWTFGCVFEPQYSIARIILCQFIAFSAIFDDTYDSYGTIDELQLLTDAVESFTIDAVDELPECMKFLYKIMLEFGKNDGAQGSSYKTTFVKEKIKELAACYLLETTWQKERKAPSFDEYLKTGRVTGVYGSCASIFLLRMENMGMKEIQWMKTDPEICDGATLHIRLMNDIDGVLTDETKREDFPKAVDCYMIQYGASQDEAIQALKQILENKWKGMNKDLMKPNDIPRILLKFSLNYARMSILYFHGTDLYTYGHNLKEYVESFFINPLPM